MKPVIPSDPSSLPVQPEAVADAGREEFSLHVVVEAVHRHFELVRIDIGDDVAGLNADLLGAVLTGAVVRDASFDGANFEGADLRGAIGLSVDQLCSASHWRSALLDGDLQAAAQVR